MTKAELLRCLMALPLADNAKVYAKLTFWEGDQKQMVDEPIYAVSVEDDAVILSNMMT